MIMIRQVPFALSEHWFDDGIDQIASEPDDSVLGDRTAGLQDGPRSGASTPTDLEVARRHEESGDTDLTGEAGLSPDPIGVPAPKRLSRSVERSPAPDLAVVTAKSPPPRPSSPTAESTVVTVQTPTRTAPQTEEATPTFRSLEQIGASPLATEQPQEGAVDVASIDQTLNVLDSWGRALIPRPETASSKHICDAKQLVSCLRLGWQLNKLDGLKDVISNSVDVALPPFLQNTVK